jgi:hypothetical protein
MSYGLMVYAVNIEQLQTVCGGGDLDLYEQILHRFGEEIGTRNYELGLQPYHQSDPTLFDAIQHLIIGQTKVFDGDVYGYALEYIVRYFGQSMNNAMFYPCDLKILSTTIGDQLTGVQIDNLVFRGLIAGVPYPIDFPTYGHLKAGEVANATAQLQGVSAYYADRDMDELAFIVGWLQYAADRHEGLVGYYY